MRQIACSFFLFVLLATAGAGQVLAEKRVALVIGNSDYRHVGKLRNPKNDAQLMAATLRRVGFAVTTLIDVDQRAMKKAMRDFGRALRGSGAVGLFYYAGHGVQVAGENYLIPVNANLADESEIEFDTVNVNAFLQTMERASSRINIVILDACRNNPFARSFRSATRGLARVDAPRGTYIAYATSPGDVAQDGKTGNSPYTSALAKAIELPGLTIEQVFKQARNDVLATTQEQQVPWETSSITGEFFFGARPLSTSRPATKLPAETKPTAPRMDPRAIELTYWNSIKDSGSRSAFEAYLKQFPEGLFATLARIRLEQIAVEEKSAADKGAPPKAPKAAGSPADLAAYELTYWKSISSSTNIAVFESYLKAYPKGVFQALAKLRIEELKKGGGKRDAPDQAALTPPKQKAPAKPFDGTWRLSKSSPTCPNKRATFTFSIRNGKAYWGGATAVLSANGSIRLTTNVRKSPMGKLQGTFSGRLKGSSGSGSFTGRNLTNGMTCKGSFKMTRISK